MDTPRGNAHLIRKRKKRLHLNAQEGRTWLRGLGVEEESPCELDSPSFTISTISESEEPPAAMAMVAVPVVEDEAEYSALPAVYACIREGLPSTSIRAAVQSQVSQSAKASCKMTCFGSVSGTGFGKPP
jgi:hypothetical protein